MKSKRGSATLYVAFIILGIIIVVIGAIAAPLGVRFTSEMYAAGEVILNDSQPAIDSIQDVNVRESIMATVASAKGATEDNVEIFGAAYQYSWVLFIIIAGLIMFLATRSQVERQVRGGGFI